MNLTKNPRIIRPGNLSSGFKPARLVLNPGSNRVYFENGLPCRCYFDLPINPQTLLDYFSELLVKRVDLSSLNNLKNYQQCYAGFTINPTDHTLKVEIIKLV